MSKESKKEAKDISKGLAAALDEIRKEFGDGAVIQGGQIIKVDTISTGAMSLDVALGAGGIPRGLVTEIFGPEASGKTTLCLELIASVQRAGGIAAFIDAEQSLSLKYAREGPGVDVDKLLLSQPSCGEEALSIAEKLAKSGEVTLIVIDSVAALVPKAEIEGEMGAATMGGQARLMGQGMRKLAHILKKTNTAMVFTNQIREKIGVMFGNPETTTGGRALMFKDDTHLDIRRDNGIKNAEKATVGNHVRVTVKKNKVGMPFTTAEFDIIFGVGIDHISSLVDAAEVQGIVKRSGSSFKYNDKSYLGKQKLIEFLKSNEDVAKALEAEIRAKLQMSTTPISDSDKESEQESETIDLNEE